MNNRNELKRGAILSYLLIFVNTIYGLLITPFILETVGNVDYGVFKSVSSLSASLTVLDLGLGSTMTRYISQYHARNDKENAQNFAAMIMLQFLAMAGLILLCGIVCVLSLDEIYAKTFSEKELILAGRLMSVLLLNVVLRLFENLLTGITNGYERFVASNSVRVVTLVAKMALLGILLPMIGSVIVVVVLESVVTLCAIAVLIIYIMRKIGFVPRLVKWDKPLFRESFGYTGLMFVQTLTVQFNGNVDNILIGASMGAASVALYSVALQLFGMYETLSGSIANIMLPNISKRVAAGQTAEQLQSVVEKCGRMQLLILGAALGGFVVLGQDFFCLWLGEGYQDCYYIALILMIPVTFAIIENVALSILRARNKMVYRTITLAISCLINIVITSIGLRYWGYWGAALGTAVSTICNLVFMNIYYHQKLNFKIIPMFAHILNRIVVCVIAATAVSYYIHLHYFGSWISFLVNAAVYMVTYIALLLCWGLNQDEKTLLMGRIGMRRNTK